MTADGLFIETATLERLHGLLSSYEPMLIGVAFERIWPTCGPSQTGRLEEWCTEVLRDALRDEIAARMREVAS